MFKLTGLGGPVPVLKNCSRSSAADCNSLSHSQVWRYKGRNLNCVSQLDACFAFSFLTRVFRSTRTSLTAPSRPLSRLLLYSSNPSDCSHRGNPTGTRDFLFHASRRLWSSDNSKLVWAAPPGVRVYDCREMSGVKLSDEHR